MDTHFNPAYGPWDERMCIVPDGDFYRAIRSGNATVATDTIKTFTPEGIELESGQFLAADIVVAATGLKVLPFGGIGVSVDGEAIDWTDSVAYKSLMISGLPNFIFGFGYTNNSWTLKIDLASDYLARLLHLMDQRGVDTVIPGSPADDAERSDMILDLSSGYIRRAMDIFPRQVQDSAWSFQSDYGFDKVRLGAEIDDGTLEFGRIADGSRQSDKQTEVAA